MKEELRKEIEDQLDLVFTLAENQIKRASSLYIKYYKELKRVGFTDEQAFELTKIIDFNNKK